MQGSYRTARIVETRNLFLGRLRHCVWAVEQEDPARKTCGLAPADMNGTRSIREECAPPASISGLKPSASLAVAGRRIRIGMLIDRNEHPSLAIQPSPHQSGDYQCR